MADTTNDVLQSPAGSGTGTGPAPTGDNPPSGDNPPPDLGDLSKPLQS